MRVFDDEYKQYLENKYLQEVRKNDAADYSSYNTYHNFYDVVYKPFFRKKVVATFFGYLIGGLIANLFFK